MSSNLYWRPVVDDKNMLGYALKFALRQHCGVGTLDPTEMTADLIPWLQGIVDSNGQGAGEARGLIALIKKHGTVLVWEEN